MTSALQELWPGLQTSLETLAGELRTRHPGLWGRAASTSNDAFPFSANLSFISGDPKVDEEDVVFSLSFKAQGSLILFDSDIAAGSGEILMDGPTDQFDSKAPDGDELDWGRRCVAEALGFAQANLRAIEDALR